jgi:hypothetical protein
MNRKYLLIFFMIAPELGIGQDISGSLGFGSYAMSGLHARQQMYVNMYYGKPKVVEDFPAYFYYDITVAFPIVKRFSIGLAFSSHSTGGRVHYADQTGEIQVDHLVSGTFIAVYPRFRVIDKPAYSLTLYAKDGIILSKVSYHEKFVLNGTTQSQRNDSGEGMAASLELGLIANKELIPHVYAQLSLGYHMNHSPAEISFPEHPSFYDNEVSCDWSGVRIAAGIQLKLK